MTELAKNIEGSRDWQIDPERQPFPVFSSYALVLNLPLCSTVTGNPWWLQQWLFSSGIVLFIKTGPVQVGKNSEEFNGQN